MKKLLNIIKEILSSKPSAIIAVDGMCASGKTTLASLLAKEFGMQVIHMDDFFLPYDMRTPERLSLPGGNIHYERFVEEVINPIKIGKNCEYRVFSCSEGNFTATKSIITSKPIIIEGAYSMHPEIPDIYDLKIFSEISPETQLIRIEKRNGTAALTAFKEKWIPFENQYFKAFKIKDKCDITITNE
ncbi:MAG: uridine kinase [Clostridia bacterium]|nr:uridine kinase [Clostridia bacterium]